MKVRELIVKRVLREKWLQDVFDFQSEAEEIYYKGQYKKCRNIEEWGDVMKNDGAWGDSSLIKIFSNISGITIHVIPTEFLTVTTVTHYSPDKDFLDEAGITLVHGAGHFKIAVPTEYPNTVKVERIKSVDSGINIDLSSDDQVFSSKSNKKSSPQSGNNYCQTESSASQVKIKKRERCDKDENDRPTSKKFKKDSPSNEYGWVEGETLADKLKKINERFQFKSSKSSSQTESSPTKEMIKKDCEYVKDTINKSHSNDSWKSSPDRDLYEPSSNEEDEEGFGVKTRKGKKRKDKGDLNLETLKSKKIKKIIENSPGNNYCQETTSPHTLKKKIQPGIKSMFTAAGPKPSMNKSEDDHSNPARNLEDTLDNETEKLEQSLKLKDKRHCKVRKEWFYDCGLKDGNGDMINRYLRRVPGNDYLLSCSICQNGTFSVKFKGFSAIKIHANSVKHKQLIESNKQNESIGKYIEKSLENQVTDAEVSLMRWAATHTLSLNKTVPHLVKILKTSFPDSKICQEMGNLSASRLAYGLTHGVGKTEQDQTIIDLSTNPFSLQLDGGMKGGRHRVNYLVRYFDDKKCQVVDKVIIAKTLNIENARAVADIFLDYCSSNSVDLENNLVMVNSDHASTLRGHETGAVVRIAKKSPNILKTDIGGDILHDLNNLTKPCFIKSFKPLVKILEITNTDIRGSAQKLQCFTEICSKLGLDTSKPKRWASSRFLSRVQCLKERRKRLLAYSDYYSQAKVPAPKRKRKTENLSGNNYFQIASDDSSEASGDEITESEERQPKAKKIKWMKHKLEEEFKETVVDLELAIEVLEPVHVLLEVFQYQKPMVHLIKPTLVNFVRDSFKEITSAKNLKHNNGELMGGDSLKHLSFETKQAKEDRKEQDKETEEKKINFEKERSDLEDQLERADMLKEKLVLKKSLDKIKKELKILEGSLSSGKFATLYESGEITLSKTMRETIKKITDNEKDKKDLVRKLEKRAKEKKLEFYTHLAENIKKYLPLDNRMLSKLVYLDPLRIEDDKTEKSFRYICQQLPKFINETEIDEVVSELRNLQLNLSDMGDLFTEYCKQRKNISTNECDVERIDTIWSKVIQNPKYQFLGKFLRAVLSFIHSTTGAEGSIQDFRKIVGSYSHRTSDATCTARMSVISATRASTADCCYDYNNNVIEHRRNWRNSHHNCKENELEKDREEDEVTSDSE